MKWLQADYSIYSIYSVYKSFQGLLMCVKWAFFGGASRYWMRANAKALHSGSWPHLGKGHHHLTSWLPMTPTFLTTMATMTTQPPTHQQVIMTRWSISFLYYMTMAFKLDRQWWWKGPKQASHIVWAVWAVGVKTSLNNAFWYVFFPFLNTN